MVRIIDVNKHGIRREIDHQWKPKKKERKNAKNNKGNNKKKDV